MANQVTTVEFRFDKEGCRKDGIFFSGPIELLALPKVGDCFDLDQPTGLRGCVLQKDVNTLGRMTEVVLHCQVQQEHPAADAKAPSLLRRIKQLLIRG